MTMSRLLLLLSVAIALASCRDIAPTDANLNKDCELGKATGDFLAQSSPDVLENLFAQAQGYQSALATDATPCLFLSQGWWIYELCWTRYMRQLHLSNGKIESEFYLGLGPKATPDDAFLNKKSAYADGAYSVATQLAKMRASEEWRLASRADPQNFAPSDGTFKCNTWVADKLRQVRFAGVTANGALPPAAQPDTHLMVATRYTAGTLCDKTGFPRQTLVVLACEHENTVKVAFNVSEDAPCQYVVYVFGSAVCAVLRGEEIPSSGTPQQGAAGIEGMVQAPQATPRAQQSQQSRQPAADAPIRQPSRYDRGSSGKPSNDDGKAKEKEGEDAEEALRRLLQSQPSRRDSAVAEQKKPPPPAPKPDDELPPLFEGSMLFTLRP